MKLVSQKNRFLHVYVIQNNLIYKVIKVSCVAFTLGQLNNVRQIDIQLSQAHLFVGCTNVGKQGTL